MDNLLPSFRVPRPSESRSMTDVRQSYAAKHPSTATEARKAADTARRQRLRHRSGVSTVAMDGWHFNPPFLRPTVLYDGSVPKPVTDGEHVGLLRAAGSASLARLTDGPRQLPGSRSMAVSLRPGQFSVQKRLLSTAHATVRVPLPQERDGARGEERFWKGKTMLPPVTVHPASGSVDIGPSSVLVANAHTDSRAEVFMSLNQKIQRVGLPAQMGSLLDALPSSKTPSSRPFRLPMEFKVVPDHVRPPSPPPPAVSSPPPRASGPTPPSTHTNPMPGQFLFSGDPETAEDQLALVPTEGGDRHHHHDDGDGDGDDAASADLWDTAEYDLEPTSLPPPSAGKGAYFSFMSGHESLALRLPPSVADDTPVVLEFRNSHPDHTAEVYWVDYDGQLTLRRVLEPGQGYQELTWATHPWVVRDDATKESMLVCAGPGIVKEPLSCSAVWNSDPSVRAVSLFWQSAAAKRLSSSKHGTGPPPDKAGAGSGTGGGLSVAASGKLVVKLDSALPGGGVGSGMDSVVLDEGLQHPKISVSMTAQASKASSFLEGAFKVKHRKQRPWGKKGAKKKSGR